MAKRDREKLLREVQELADRFSEADDLLTPADVRSTLEMAGCDDEQLREQLYRAAHELAAKQRAKGKAAPLAVQQVVEATGLVEMPSDLRTALEKAKRWVTSFGQPVPVGDLGVVRAYRKSKDLSENDQRLLDDLEEELKRRARDENAE
jgi:hypothetical protein